LLCFPGGLEGNKAFASLSKDASLNLGMESIAHLSCAGKKNVLQWGFYPATIIQRNLLAFWASATLALYPEICSQLLSDTNKE